MSVVACCHSAKLCAYAVRDFRSQHMEAETRGIAWATWKIVTKYISRGSTWQ